MQHTCTIYNFHIFFLLKEEITMLLAIDEAPRKA